MLTKLSIFFDETFPGLIMAGSCFALPVVLVIAWLLYIGVIGDIGK